MPARYPGFRSAQAGLRLLDAHRPLSYPKHSLFRFKEESAMKLSNSLAIAALLSVFAVSEGLAQVSSKVINKDPNTGVTTTTTKSSGGTTITEVFDPASGKTTTTVTGFDGKTAFTSISKKDATSGNVVTDWTDSEGTTGQTVVETNPDTGENTTTIQRSDGTFTVIKKDKTGGVKSKTVTNAKKGYKEVYQTTATRSELSTTLTYNLQGKQYIENSIHEYSGRTTKTHEQMIVNGQPVYDVETETVTKDDGTIGRLERFGVVTLFYKDYGVKLRDTSFNPKTGKTSVTYLELSDGTIRKFDEGEYVLETSEADKKRSEFVKQSSPAAAHQATTKRKGRKAARRGEGRTAPESKEESRSGRSAKSHAKRGGRHAVNTGTETRGPQADIPGLVGIGIGIGLGMGHGRRGGEHEFGRSRSRSPD
jgi:hypothetical protein